MSPGPGQVVVSPKLLYYLHVHVHLKTARPAILRLRCSQRQLRRPQAVSPTRRLATNKPRSNSERRKRQLVDGQKNYKCCSTAQHKPKSRNGSSPITLVRDLRPDTLFKYNFFFIPKWTVAKVMHNMEIILLFSTAP